MARRPPVQSLPAQIGPCQLSAFGETWIAVRCPQDYDPLMRQAGGVWEPGGRRWLVERRRIGPLMRNLRRATEQLFRRVGMDLDEGLLATCSPVATKRSNAASVQRRRDKLRAMGLRPVRIWVPDTSAPGFAAEAARQAQLLAEWEASPAGREEMAFWDSLAGEAWVAID